jgi:predicted ester cyclase
MSWTITGSNTGVFGELPHNGKRIKISGITRMDFDDEGKIAVEQVYYNELSLMQQLGHTLSPPVLE